MSQPCTITKCKRTSRGLCDCCKQNLCLQHLNEHNASLISQLNPLTDEINALGDRLKELNIQKTVGDGRQKLEQWHVDCHQKIDRFFKQKCEELDQLVDKKVRKQKEEVSRIQSKIAELIREEETTRQDIDLLTSTIRHLKIQMNNIEQIRFQINTHPLVIDDSLIHITERSERMIDLSTLLPVYKTISRPAGSSMSLANNDRFLLIHRAPTLCLVDQGMNIAKEVLWTQDKIYDMCWSSTLNRFIVIGENNVFLVDENKMLMDDAKIQKRNWLSCACSDTFLFLSTNEFTSSIMQFGLLPSIELVKELKSPHTCARNEIINDIVCRNETLALMIGNGSNKSIRMELRSVETLNRIWLLLLDIACDRNLICCCCSLTCNEWLVADPEKGRLLQITEDGKIKKTIEYDPRPYHVNLFGPHTIAISRNGGINLHKL